MAKVTSIEGSKEYFVMRTKEFWREWDKFLRSYILSGGGTMRERKKKEYKVTVSYVERTPEEAERLEAEITEAIYRSKMIALKKREKETLQT